MAACACVVLIHNFSPRRQIDRWPRTMVLFRPLETVGVQLCKWCYVCCPVAAITPSWQKEHRKKTDHATHCGARVRPARQCARTTQGRPIDRPRCSRQRRRRKMRQEAKKSARQCERGIQRRFLPLMPLCLLFSVIFALVLPLEVKYTP